MKVIIWIVASLGFASCYPTGEISEIRNASSRIVGGVECSRNEFPFLVSVQDSTNTHICGGVIISNMYILSSAHCFRSYSPSSLRIVAGEHSFIVEEGPEQIRQIDRITAHPSHNPYTYENDIALVKLRTPLAITNTVAPISLAPAGFTVSGNALVLGWGRTSEGGSSSQVPRKVTVPIITDAACRLVYGSLMKDSMICAGQEGKDSCQGDSGGPLTPVYNGERILVGLVSWGLGCARPGYPGVYTEISHFRTWISQNTRE